VLQQQWVDTAVGDTFWVQSPLAPSSAQGLVTIHDNAPTNHRWNYAAVEITAAPAAQVAGAAKLSAAKAEVKKVAATSTVRTSTAAHLKYCRLTGTTRRFS
jgi:predicted metal-dependent enzyme (double-stranded beta helix superfamily)